MGLGSVSDLVDDGDGGLGSKDNQASSISCSICLDLVSDSGDRSWAKLQCGHHFHLDCIGSAFNIKGTMQCPNCRKVEKGQWLFGNSYRPCPDISMDDLIPDEDLYDINYSEMSFGVQWCPFGGLARLSSFDDTEFPTASYHDMLSQHGVFTEPAAVPPATHPCPYIAYFGPIQPPASSQTVSENSNFNGHWNSPNEVPASYAIPNMDMHYHGWEPHSPHFSAPSSGRVSRADQLSAPSTQRSSRSSSDLSRPVNVMHPFLFAHHNVGGGRAGGGGAPSQSYPGSSARSRNRVQALQAYYQQQPPTPPSVMASMAPTGVAPSSRASVSSSDQTPGYYFFPPGRNYRDSETPLSNHFMGWDRDHHSLSFTLNDSEREAQWGAAFHQPTGGGNGAALETGMRPRGFRQWHGPSQNRT